MEINKYINFYLDFFTLGSTFDVVTRQTIMNTKFALAPQSALTVLTVKSGERLINTHGSGDWKLDRVKARKSQYIVCCRNANSRKTKGSEPHGMAFLVGRISDVVEAPGDSGRWIVKFDQYALIEKPDVWERTGLSRNPIRYTSMKQLGIDPGKLNFVSVPPEPSPSRDVSPDEGDPVEPTDRLTIVEAKRRLAKTFGVSPEAVEITIRG